MSYHEGETTTVRACCMFRQNFDYVYKETEIVVRPAFYDPQSGAFIGATYRARWESNFKYDEEVKCEFDCKAKDEMEVDKDEKGSGPAGVGDLEAGDVTNVTKYTVKWEKVTKAGRCNSKRVGALIGKGCECHIDKNNWGRRFWPGKYPGDWRGTEYQGPQGSMGNQAALVQYAEDHAEEMRRGPYVDEGTINFIEQQLKYNLKEMKKKEGCKDLTTAQKNRCCSGKKPEREGYDIRVGPPVPDPADMYQPQPPPPNLPFGR